MARGALPLSGVKRQLLSLGTPLPDDIFALERVQAHGQVAEHLGVSLVAVWDGRAGAAKPPAR